MKKQGYSYVRVSGRSQIDGDGHDRQIRAITNYAKKNKIQIVQTYQEQETGTVEQRAQLAQMLRELKQNPAVRYVIVEKLDRVARDLLVQERVVASLRQLDVNLISVMEGADLLSQDPTRKFIRQTLGAVAELDKSLLVEKLRSSREKIRATTGKCEGRKSAEELQPDLLNEIRRLRRKPPHKKPLSYTKIAQILNDRGIQTVTGKPFNAWLVRYFCQPNRTKRARRATKTAQTAY